MGASVVHFEVNSDNPDALKSFYADLFAWEITEVPGEYYQVETGANSEVRGGIGKARGQSGVTFYVKVPDLSEALSRAEALGARTAMPPTAVGQSRLAGFVDPQGHYIGLMEG